MSELRGALRALDGVRTPVGPDAFAEEGGDPPRFTRPIRCLLPGIHGAAMEKPLSTFQLGIAL